MKEFNIKDENNNLTDLISFLGQGGYKYCPLRESYVDMDVENYPKIHDTTEYFPRIKSSMKKKLEDNGAKPYQIEFFCTSEKHFNIETIHGDLRYIVVTVYDNVTEESLGIKIKYMWDLGYSVHKFPTLEDAYGFMGSLFCGGMYIGMGLFDRDGKNLCNLEKKEKGTLGLSNFPEGGLKFKVWNNG